MVKDYPELLAVPVGPPIRRPRRHLLRQLRRRPCLRLHPHPHRERLNNKTRAAGPAIRRRPAERVSSPPLWHIPNGIAIVYVDEPFFHAAGRR